MFNYTLNQNVIPKEFQGLSEKKAKEQLIKYGENVIESKKRTSKLGIFINQFKDFMVLILLVSTAVSAFMGEATEAMSIILVVIINSFLGFLQELRTEKTMDALKKLTTPNSKVIRDGLKKTISAKDIVPDDIIVLEAGDRVPSDAILLEANFVKIDESVLTGESLPVEKKVNCLSNENKNTYIYMGTILLNGTAKAKVIKTGMHTEMGKIAGMLQSIEDELTPLQKRLGILGKQIVYGCLLICFIVSFTGVLRGESLFSMLLSGISLAVASVPEGLPAIVTISLALGVQRMLKKNVLVKKLPAVETLGCASVICSDKTGTLTKNQMTVRKIYAGGTILEITQNKNLEFLINGKNIEPLKIPSIKLAIEIAVLCSNIDIQKPLKSFKNTISRLKNIINKEENITVIGDPTEIALFNMARKCNIKYDELIYKYIRISEIPFDSERKLMSVVCIEKNTKCHFIFTKGAPENLLEKCTKVLINGELLDLTKDIKMQLLKVNDQMANDALRILGLAYKKLNYIYEKDIDTENDLTFVGFMGMIDPPRSEVKEAVRKCIVAGIRPIMITGDHKITALSIAKEVGIFKDGDYILEGKELEKMTEYSLAKRVEKISVYARVLPKHKLMIVRALKKIGHVVAMTGDGVNDAPAIKEADIGVSMGVTGTDVSKEASSMVLLDDNFATIVSAVEEGRVIYNNIRKFIRYMFACNIGEVITMFLAMLVGLPLPLLPIQILWVNLVTDGLPAIALGLEPADKNIMMRPPRREDEHIFSNGLLNIIIFRGILIGLCTLAVFLTTNFFTNDIELSRTGAFVTLVLTQLIHVFECKSETKSIFEVSILNNIALLSSVILSFAMVLAVIYIPFFQSIFKTTPLFFENWILIIGFSTIGPIISSIYYSIKKSYIKNRD